MYFLGGFDGRDLQILTSFPVWLGKILSILVKDCVFFYEFQFRPKLKSEKNLQSIVGENEITQRNNQDRLNEINEDSRFEYRHNYPYKRQPKLGDFGIKRSTTTKRPTTDYHSHLGFVPIEANTESPKDATAGPFVTMPHVTNENSTVARQPKKAKYSDYSSSSNINEVRVLPPEEFHHLLSRVDGTDKKVGKETISKWIIRFLLCLLLTLFSAN